MARQPQMSPRSQTTKDSQAEKRERNSKVCTAPPLPWGRNFNAQIPIIRRRPWDTVSMNEIHIWIFSRTLPTHTLCPVGKPRKNTYLHLQRKKKREIDIIEPTCSSLSLLSLLRESYACAPPERKRLCNKTMQDSRVAASSQRKSQSVSVCRPLTYPIRKNDNIILQRGAPMR